MTIIATLSTSDSASPSIRARVVSVSGRKIANSSAFHTQSHLVSASTGKSALRVVHQQ